MTVLVLVLALVLAGVVGGVTVVLRGNGAAAGGLEADPMSPRLSADVHAGEEQVLIHLARSLGLPAGRDDVGYGEVYIAGSAGSSLRLASRSEIGRGFDGEIRVRRTRRSSVLEYFVLRVPGDERVLGVIASLDDRIVGAVRRLDPAAQVRRFAGQQGTARGFEPTTP